MSSKMENVLIKRDRTRSGLSLLSVRVGLCYMLAHVRVLLEGLGRTLCMMSCEHCHPLLAHCSICKQGHRVHNVLVIVIFLCGMSFNEDQLK